MAWRVGTLGGSDLVSGEGGAIGPARTAADRPGGRRGRRGRRGGWCRCPPGLSGPRRGRVPDAAWQAAGDIFTSALRLGGTLTGKHGVGTLKRSRSAQELGPEQPALQHRIKAAFDPHHILNQDKALSGGVVVEPAAREALERVADQFLAALGGRVSLEAAA
ncbi:FAD-linked oxidase C-terminal domain-containing protein [Streptomyces sp. NPDC006602]|uniref:FAD-linked oxidase C-terminal domain-containing protein n=1 Tax=Streptomyces sp. NPDC006602 TaxID=3364751 RepID=UPI0036977AFF